MIPFGILNLENDRFHIFYGNSYKTSDFVCDAIEAWWEEEKTDFPDADELVIFSDNGPESNSHRTQFLARMVDFGIQTGLKIHPVYYPPYHSKYNPVERPWSSLENRWSGALLNTVQSVLEWTKTMTWKSMKPVVNFLDKVYHKGVRLNKVELAEIAPHIVRHANLPSTISGNFLIATSLRGRLSDCGLTLHPVKTELVYCKATGRPEKHEHTSFDFLSYTFRARIVRSWYGNYFAGFLPAISRASAQHIQDTIRELAIPKKRSGYSLPQLAKLINPYVQGWINYFGEFFPSEMKKVLYYVEETLVR